MSAQFPSRRITSQQLSQDVDSLNGLNVIRNYTTSRSIATPENLQLAYRTMLTCQQAETEQQVQYKAAIDAARQAEWEFHNAVLAMKEAVRGQYGSDSNEAQAIGLKKKSERKRPSRSKPESVAS